MTSIVPNQFPTFTKVPYKIAIIGEAPGADETITGTPFVGAAGYLLSDLLSSAGIIRNACFVGNICQVRPPGNDIKKFDWNGPEIQNGLQALTVDLDRFNPNICVLLGNTALRAAKDNEASISDYRGTLFLGNGKTNPFSFRKCIATYHPAALLRQYEWSAVTRFDLRRAREEGENPELLLPDRYLIVPDLASPVEYIPYVMQRLEEIRVNKTLIALDIEGYVDRLSCLSIATSPTDAFIIPFSTGVGSYVPSVEQETHLWRLLSSVLSDPSIPKVLQNSLYDNFVLSWSYRCPIRGIVDDTMLKHWERYSELEKSLAFQTSIYTKEPFYKGDQRSNDLPTFWRYCCRDSAVTHEINTVIDNQMEGNPFEKIHYAFNMMMLEPIHYMEQRGIRYDYEKAQTRRHNIIVELKEVQDALNTIAGREVNTSSPKQMVDYFYNTLGLPPVLNRKTGSPTLNYEALLSLAKKTSHPALLHAIKIRSLRTRSQMLAIQPDPDGRIRCGYNVVGTESGRITCYTSPTGSGYNLQTIPEYDRDLFIADDGHSIFQRDLSGADGWTVAAHCAALGDSTMLDDLLAGLKIAKVLALMFKEGPEVSNLQRSDLKDRTDPIPKTDPLVFGGKCCQHGSNYGMGKVLLSATIFIQSEGKVNISARDAEKFQDLYFKRYPGVLRWHEKIQHEIKTKGYISSASGHRRRFFGRRNDHATLKAALANEPQENTTYVTNRATLALWNDRDNRRESGHLRVECLHTVHDALVGQFRDDELAFAANSIDRWFNVDVVVAGIRIKIPSDGAYGKSWGTLREKI